MTEKKEPPLLDVGGRHEKNGHQSCGDDATSLAPCQELSPVAAAMLAQREYFGESPEPESARQGEGKPDAYTLLTAEEVINAPPMEWTVKGILPRRGVGQVFGASMSGKSFLLLSMAESIAEGKEWYGFRVKPAPVVYVVLEGEEGFRKRVRALMQWCGHALSANLFFLIQPFAVVNTEGDVLALSDCVPRGALVIIDTQNASSPFVDENSARDMGSVINGAKTLARAVDGFVLLVAHTGKDPNKGPRGSSTQIPAWDCCLEVVYAKDGKGRREWVSRKVKDGEDGKRFPFRLEVVDLGVDEDGDRITSCVAVPDESAPAGQEERIIGKPLPLSLQTALDTLQNAIGDGQQGVHLDVWRTAYYKASTADSQAAKRQAFGRARASLVSMHRVLVEDDIYSIPAAHIAINASLSGVSELA